MEDDWDETSDMKESAMTAMSQAEGWHPAQRPTLHQPQNMGYLFANAKYYTVIQDNSMLSDLPPWYMVLGPGTITALRTIRALLRIKIPMETDFSTIYRLMRTVCLSITFDEVIDAMMIFFGPPKQTFEEFLLGFAIRKKKNISEERFSIRECIFYSAITYFSIENFEKGLTTPIPPLTVKQIPPALYWVLNQSVKNSTHIVKAFTRLLLAAKSPYVRSLPNSLISFIKLDQATRQFDWCDCKKKAVKYDYLHTKNAHKDMPWLVDEWPYLPTMKFIEKQPSFKKILQRATERWYIPFSHPQPSLFKKEGKLIDVSNSENYLQLYQRAKRIYETKLNKNFERSALAYWKKYYKGRVPRNTEGRLFEVFKAYHRTQFCPRKREKIKDIYQTTKFKSMPDYFDYAEVFEDPEILSYFCCHPHSEYDSSEDTQTTYNVNNCQDLELYDINDSYNLNYFTDNEVKNDNDISSVYGNGTDDDKYTDNREDDDEDDGDDEEDGGDENGRNSDKDNISDNGNNVKDNNVEGNIVMD